MIALGIVSEYNPFHNGHRYHIEESKKLTNADFVICVMSGNFVQRGEPALINKWARTKSALLSGVDLVIELPTPFALSSAEFFAAGAIKILDSLGVVSYLSFGSELGKIEPLKELAEVFLEEPYEYKKYLKTELQNGISFPSARANAVCNYLKKYKKYSQNEYEKINSLLSSSNNILGIEYLKALSKLKSKITPITIKRISSQYNEIHLRDSISSATAIRNSIKTSSEYIYDNTLISNFQNNTNTLKERIKQNLPNTSFDIISEEFLSGKGPVFPESFENQIFTLLRKSTAEDILRYPYISEGLENRILKAANESGNMKEFFEKCTTKRFANTRINRILFNMLIDITYDDYINFVYKCQPPYIRILGFNKKGREILQHISLNAKLPIVTKAASFKNSENEEISRMLKIESTATDIYVLAYQNSKFRTGGQEFTTTPIVIK